MSLQSDVKIVKRNKVDFPDGAVDKNLPANSADMGSIPGLGWTHISEQLRPCTTTFDPACLEPVFRNKKPLQWEARTPQLESSPPRCN